jgi:hypothetical protein
MASSQRSPVHLLAYQSGADCTAFTVAAVVDTDSPSECGRAHPAPSGKIFQREYETRRSNECLLGLREKKRSSRDLEMVLGVCLINSWQDLDSSQPSSV